MRENMVLLADYNRWINQRIYAAASQLSPGELARDRGAFFGSILGTLNHIAVGDTVWLKRFAQHPAPQPALDPVRRLPAPQALDQRLFDDFGALRAHRAMLDDMIVRWAAELEEAELEKPLHYTNMRGERFARRFSSLVLHFFNHQTHHRGQVTTLLSQAGVDVGATDLLAIIPEASSG
ncbi:MAG: DinB family protein [Burkholderiales bacterium]|nr:MAG: DinB family protein [Burkholderiales bacterium]